MKASTSLEYQANSIPQVVGVGHEGTLLNQANFWEARIVKAWMVSGHNYMFSINDPDDGYGVLTLVCKVHKVVLLAEMIRSIAKRWRTLSGQDRWKNLLDPLDIDLRRYIIHYGEMAQATYDNFNREPKSKFAGSSIYSRRNLFSEVCLAKANTYTYTPTKYLYATSEIKVPAAFILKPIPTDPWSNQSNWIGFVAVATDEGKAALGRRDILVAWRGTVQTEEWLKNFDFPLASASMIFGEKGNPNAHRGWLSIYTSHDPKSQFNKQSARDQVLSEVMRLVDKYKDEEISITITGHSLGAALGTLCAADIVANKFNKLKDQPQKSCPVTAFLFGSPRVGDLNFRNVWLSLENLHLLRVTNVPDIVTTLPPEVYYAEVGQELVIDTRRSNFMKLPGGYNSWHCLESYLHGVAGTQGSKGGFHLEVDRSIALVNKMIDGLKDEYPVPAAWWCMRNKGMKLLADGSWELRDHEKDDNEP